MIAIFSDLHDNLANFKIAQHFCQENNITDLIFCGDLTTPDTLRELAHNFQTIYLVAGNCEIYTEQDIKKYTNIHYFARKGKVFKYKNKKIGLCHEPYRIESLQAQQPDIIFYGHTHKPWENTALVDNKQIKLVNPGNLANVRYQASFALYNPENDKLSLKILNELK